MHKDHGMIKLFKEPSGFLSSIYMEIVDIPTKEYANYINAFKLFYPHIIDMFPKLRINFFPYSKIEKCITLTGVLITKQVIQEFSLTEEDEFLRFGIKVFIVVPLDFVETGLKIFDYYRIIDFSKIPNPYLHFRKTSLNNIVLCTHHKDFIKPSDPVISVLFSAWALFVEYKKLE
ncbi:MAG: hypothetical protein RBQ97_10780, partial [Acholeplasma sp.]|nr:hypothetical protein [Acholeplasma sp.]